MNYERILIIKNKISYVFEQPRNIFLNNRLASSVVSIIHIVYIAAIEKKN